MILGTARSPEQYLDRYERYGDPHCEPGSRLTLLGACRKDRNAIDAMREIRTATGLGLKSAKRALDAALRGDKPVLECADAEAAGLLASRLRELGFETAQLSK